MANPHPRRATELIHDAFGSTLRISDIAAHAGVHHRIIHDLARGVQDGLMASAGGRFFGWVRGGALPVAVAADWLTSA